MATLYLMRHGETMFNEQCKIQGWCDSPLTERGCEQARAAGRMLAARGVVVDHAYCSTAERASDTLELVLGAMGQPMAYERMKGLREHYHGVLEGESERLNAHVDFHHMDEFYLQFGGETVAQTRDRVVAAIEDVMARPGHGSVLVVSHAGACLSALECWADFDELMAGGLGNCTVWVVDVDAEALREGAGAAAFSLREVLHPEA